MMSTSNPLNLGLKVLLQPFREESMQWQDEIYAATCLGLGLLISS